MDLCDLCSLGQQACLLPNRDIDLAAASESVLWQCHCLQGNSLQACYGLWPEVSSDEVISKLVSEDSPYRCECPSADSKKTQTQSSKACADIAAIHGSKCRSEACLHVVDSAARMRMSKTLQKGEVNVRALGDAQGRAQQQTRRAHPQGCLYRSCTRPHCLILLTTLREVTHSLLWQALPRRSAHLGSRHHNLSPVTQAFQIIEAVVVR